MPELDPIRPAALDAQPGAAVLGLRPGRMLRLVHEAVCYEPIAGDAALGAVLLALPCRQVDFTGARHDDRTELRLTLATARQYERILARHAARPDRSQPRLPQGVTIAVARDWVHAAAASAPPAELERFCWRLARVLGPDPWCDGRPAIALSQQQFGLFEASFESLESADARLAPR